MSFSVKKFYEFCGNLAVETKERGLMRLEKKSLLGTQTYAIQELAKGLEQDVHFFVFLKGRQLGLCVDPSTKVLTADLRWASIESLLPGQEIVAVDENPAGGRGNHRRMRTAKVIAAMRVERFAYRISFDDGRCVICTAQHPWLSKKVGTQAQWRAIDGTRTNNKKLKVGTRVRWITKPWYEPTVDDGWFGGILDGEGSFSSRKDSGASVNASQRSGLVWDRMLDYCTKRGYNFCAYDERNPIRPNKFGKTPVNRLEISRMDEVFRVIGQTRPARFINNYFWEDKELPGKKSGVGWAKIVSIEPLGFRTMIDLQTTTGTYIAEGFVSHNTTISLALDLYWLFTHQGLQGSLITDTDENREMFRTTLSMYIDSLPKEFKFPIKSHTEKQLVLAQRSRFFYQVAGTRKKAGLGRGKAITFLHGTETSSWGDEEGLASLLASLSQQNPDRLFWFESTARGPNMFEEMYRTAKTAKSQRAIFIGWWRNQFYSIQKSSPIFKTYWDGKLTSDEKDWVGDIKALYDFDITPEQIAWWRFTLTETIKDDMLMYQEYPPTEDYAFILTGITYFPVPKIRDAEKIARDCAAKRYKYVFGSNWYDTEAVEANEKLAELTVWEEPQDNGVYVLGAQPAYGPSDWAHQFVIEIYRCYADRLEQVAEFATMEINTDEFAWVIAHLGGIYRATVNMEMTGAGQSVANSLKLLRRHAQQLAPSRSMALQNVLAGMSNYIWRRNDNLNGMSNSVGWVTSHSSHERMLSYFKAGFERDVIELRSVDLLYEMKKFTRAEDGLKPRGNATDGRIIATAFACSAYAEQIHGRLIDMKLTKATSQGPQPEKAMDITVNHTVGNYLKRIGLYGQPNS